MNDAQRSLAEAYQNIDQRVMDDLVAFMRALPREDRLGATEVVTYMMGYRARKRREAVMGKRESKRGV